MVIKLFPGPFVTWSSDVRGLSLSLHEWGKRGLLFLPSYPCERRWSWSLKIHVVEAGSRMQKNVPENPLALVFRRPRDLWLTFSPLFDSMNMPRPWVHVFVVDTLLDDVDRLESPYFGMCSWGSCIGKCSKLSLRLWRRLVRSCAGISGKSTALCGCASHTPQFGNLSKLSSDSVLIVVGMRRPLRQQPSNSLG